LQWYLSAASWI